MKSREENSTHVAPQPRREREHYVLLRMQMIDIASNVILRYGVRQSQWATGRSVWGSGLPTADFPRTGRPIIGGILERSCTFQSVFCQSARAGLPVHRHLYGRFIA